MASFNPTIITKAGHALSAKIDTGVAKMSFTRIALSSATYETPQLEDLTEITDIHQSTAVSSVSVINTASVRVRGAFNNSLLKAGYYVNTIGLYAKDPDLGEILYSVTTAIVADWMPPNDGVSVSSILVDLITIISNAANVNLEIDPTATATMADISDLQDQIDALKAQIGYDDDPEVVGVQVDLENKTITRLGAARGLTAGADFNQFNMYGGRRRCVLNDNGSVAAYESDPSYKVDGTAGQVMVEQPKFYYRMMPLNWFKIPGKDGWSLSKFNLYLCDKPKTGFKIHPNFTRGVPAAIKDYIYFAAYEGCIYDVSAGSYLKTDQQIADFTVGSGDRLSSISGAKPCSGVTQELTRANTRILANNRGKGWQQQDILSSSATQMLMLVEFASFDSQTEVGQGVTGKASGTGNESVNTGACDSFGSGTGRASGEDNLSPVIYRGEENFWGNIWTWEDGLNVENNGKGNPYFALGDFQDDIGTAPYKYCGFQIANANGYVDAIGYSEECDFLFLATRTTGASNQPLNDNFYQNVAGAPWTVSQLGGGWAYGLEAGAFSRSVHDAAANRYRGIGGRLVFVPAGGPLVNDEAA